jgi:hypothetical protein
MILNIFFSIKLIRQSRRGGQKNFPEGANYRKYYRKTLFFKIQGGTAAPLTKCASAPAYMLQSSKKHPRWTRNHEQYKCKQEGKGLGLGLKWALQLNFVMGPWRNSVVLSVVLWTCGICSYFYLVYPPRNNFSALSCPDFLFFLFYIEFS